MLGNNFTNEEKYDRVSWYIFQQISQHIKEKIAKKRQKQKSGSGLERRKTKVSSTRPLGTERDVETIQEWGHSKLPRSPDSHGSNRLLAVESD